MNSGQFKKSLLYGVGIDDTQYQKERRSYNGHTSKIIWYCEVFSRWKNMIKRCYTTSDAAYHDISVCDEWLMFSNYKRWYDAQPKPSMMFDVDKDILQGLSRVYSPETCLILPRRINSFLAVANKGLPGTHYEESRGKFQSYCQSLDGTRKTLGRFDSEIDAHRAWQLHKALQVEKLIEEYTGVSNLDTRVIPCLIDIKRKIESDRLGQKPTLNLKLEIL